MNPFHSSHLLDVNNWSLCWSLNLRTDSLFSSTTWVGREKCQRVSEWVSPQIPCLSGILDHFEPVFGIWAWYGRSFWTYVTVVRILHKGSWVIALISSTWVRVHRTPWNLYHNWSLKVATPLKHSVEQKTTLSGWIWVDFFEWIITYTVGCW